MLDLNHGSACHYGGVDAPADTSALITTAIDRALLARQQEQVPRTYVSTSGLGRACLQTPIGGSSRAEHVRQRTALTHRLDRAQAAAAEVELALRALMPFAECSREQVARLTGQSLRTLQRRLARLGTTFHRMRDRVRADLAMKYLLQSRLPAYQIAEMLGYSNPGAFTRPFRRQHGVAPSAVRRRAEGGDDGRPKSRRHDASLND